MKKFKWAVYTLAILTAGYMSVACEANEFEDTDTSNPTWGKLGSEVHPNSLENTTWLRGSGLHKNAYGKDVQGFVESCDFVSADSVCVKMSQGVTEGTWNDESNTDKTPLYAYVYSSTTGKVEIIKTSVDNGKVTKTTIFEGVVVEGKKSILTLCHYGDTPVQTYLEKQ